MIWTHKKQGGERVGGKERAEQSDRHNKHREDGGHGVPGLTFLAASIGWQEIS